MGGRLLCQGGEFTLDHETEEALSAHMKDAEQVAAPTLAPCRHSPSVRQRRFKASRLLCCAMPALVVSAVLTHAALMSGR